MCILLSEDAVTLLLDCAECYYLICRGRGREGGGGRGEEGEGERGVRSVTTSLCSPNSITSRINRTCTK